MIVIAQFQVTTATSFQGLTGLHGHELYRRSQVNDQCFVSVYRVYYVITDNILIWIYQV
jgi:hypothetical protein